MKIKAFLNHHPYLIMIISILMSIGYTIFNLFLGIKNQVGWNISIGIYFFFLAIIRIIIVEKIHQENCGKDVNKNFKIFTAIYLFILDFLLMIPISLLVLRQKSVTMTLIPAIYTAAYTTYKVTMAIINYQKSKKQTIGYLMLRKVNIIDACVSVLTLQNTLIMVCGVTEKMIILSAVSSFIITLFLIVFSTKNLVDVLKVNKI